MNIDEFNAWLRIAAYTLGGVGLILVMLLVAIAIG